MDTTKTMQTENKMGTMPVGKLIFSMSVPMMISMIVQAFYNIVDSVFVSMISEDALAAVSLAFPLQSLMIAFSTGIGVGINSQLTRALGEKKPQPHQGPASSDRWEAAHGRRAHSQCRHRFSLELRGLSTSVKIC